MKKIFISCGQASESEKATGILLQSLVDAEPGFRAYFAETVQNLEALASHVLKGIQECAGAIVVLQDRGVVVQPDGTEWGRRSSVWVNQEVAILAYRQFFESTPLPVLAFIERQVKLEGAMTALIVNPRPLPPVAQLPEAVKGWLRSAPFSDSNNEVFTQMWQEMTQGAKRVIAVLFEHGGRNVKEATIRRGLARRFGVDPNSADTMLRDAKLQFMNNSVVQLIPNQRTGDELSANSTWEYELRRLSSAWKDES
jgi:hypothetical protein